MIKSREITPKEIRGLKRYTEPFRMSGCRVLVSAHSGKPDFFVEAASGHLGISPADHTRVGFVFDREYIEEGSNIIPSIKKDSYGSPEMVSVFIGHPVVGNWTYFIYALPEDMEKEGMFRNVEHKRLPFSLMESLGVVFTEN